MRTLNEKLFLVARLNDLKLRNMSNEEREKLNAEWLELRAKTSKAKFVDPKDLRRMDEITSLLLTDGESSTTRFVTIKGRQVRKGMNTKGYYDKGGKTGL